MATLYKAAKSVETPAYPFFIKPQSFPTVKHKEQQINLVNSFQGSLVFGEDPAHESPRHNPQRVYTRGSSVHLRELILVPQPRLCCFVRIFPCQQFHDIL